MSEIRPYERSKLKSVGYSPSNTPHLAPAVELETALLDLTARLPSLGLPTTLKSRSDLDQLVPHIKSAIDGARLWEFYVFDVQSSVKEVASAIQSKSAKSWSGPTVAGKSTEELARIVKDNGLIEGHQSYAGRFVTKVDSKVAAGLISAAYPGENEVDLASRWGKVLDVLNVDLYSECSDDLKAAQDAVVDRLKYTRLELQGGEITKE